MQNFPKDVVPKGKSFWMNSSEFLVIWFDWTKYYVFGFHDIFTLKHKRNDTRPFTLNQQYKSRNKIFLSHV